MAITAKLITQFLCEGVTVQGEVSVSGDTPFGGIYPIGASATDLEIDLPIPRGLQAIIFKSSLALTIKTNSTSAPDNTITTVANEPQSWVTGHGTSPVAAAAVVKFYVTNAVATACSLEIRGLMDATP